MKTDRTLGLLAAALLGAGCDAGAPAYSPLLVVEAFLEAGRPLGEITFRRTLPPDGGVAEDGVGDAAATVSFPGQAVPYAFVGAGRYRPASTPLLVPGTVIALASVWQGQVVTATTRVPPEMQLDSVRVLPAAAPVRAILLEQFGFDPARIPQEGFVYPVRIRAYWRAPAPSDTGLWVRASLRPTAESSVRFFFPPEVLLREHDTAGVSAAEHRYEGVYAVRVETETTPLPPHTLRFALVRGGPEYGRFLASRGAPDRREPLSNVNGGRGLFAAVSTDSVRVEVR